MSVRTWVLACVLACLAVPAFARADDFAPVDRAGAPLTVPTAQLAGALTCSPGIDHATKTPVLLLQGTGATAKDNWSWTYEPALDKLGIPWCQSEAPDHATGDAQINGEYVVYAIRTMYARAGRKIAIIGHSQGGMIGRWALRFWPDTRKMVDDVIGFAPSNHGTLQAKCDASNPCSAADWQQATAANFIKALNSGAETWKGISYTNVYTHTDEVVEPNHDDNGSSSLHTGEGRITNVATQDICPADVNEHLLIGLIDNVAYSLAIDALTHDGPADPKRIPASVCLAPLQPGVDPVTGPAAGAQAALDFESFKGTDVPAEPKLACYTTPTGCASQKGAAGCVTRRLFTTRVRLLRGATASVGGKRAKIKRSGKFLVVTVDLRKTTALSVQLRVRGKDAHGHKVTISKRYRPCAQG